MLEEKKGGRPSKRPDIKTLSKLYAEKTAHDIAVMYGVADVTVRSWIARYRRDLKQQKAAEKNSMSYYDIPKKTAGGSNGSFSK